ncbi:MAG: DUF4012 domain-containing protein [Chloroflexota bacterium]
MTSHNRYSNPPPAELTPEEPQVPPAERSTAARFARLLIVAGILTILVWAGLKTWRVYQATRSLLAVQEQAQLMMEGGLNDINPDDTEALVLGARADISTLQDELRFIRPIAPLFGWIPRVGPLVLAAPHLLDMADAGSEAGALAISGLKPALPILQQDDFSAARLGDLLPILTAATENLSEAEGAMERYSAARVGLSGVVAVDDLPWRVRQLIETSDELMPAAQGGLRLAPTLPAILGQDGPRRYLLLAQNEDEIRATGGFITGAGLLTIQNGQIIDLSVMDSNLVDNWREKPYDFPPQPFYDYMGLELFLFRDANFWPDFPTSAQKALELYEYGQDSPPLDGVIAIDQEFLRLLVEATGPVPVPGTNQTINANNLVRTLQEARNIQEGQEVGEWVSNRKSFLSGFASAILAKFETGVSSINPVKLAGNLGAAAETRHLSIYLRDPAAAVALAETGWDGALTTHPPGDFLMAIDTNMGYNKVNLFIERSISYEINLADGSSPRATTTLNYRHTGQPQSEPCLQGVDEEFELASDYLSLADKCYWNYVRVYTPAGSQLIDSSRQVVPGETMFNGVSWDRTAETVEEHEGLTTFATFMLLPQSEEATITFEYELPGNIISTADGLHVYELKVNKQPGMQTEPLSISVKLPPGASLRDVSPASAQVEGSVIVFRTDLDSNVVLTISYQ